MELRSLWASVRFTAQNGSPEELLSAAAQRGLHLDHILPCPGGFMASCAAWQYRPLSRLARHRRVRLRIHKRRGLFFILRPLLRRSGLWLGAAIFIPLVFWSQGLVWSVHYGSLTAGQQARAQVLLRQSGLIPGALVNEEKLAAGEYALVQSGEFSWASLNFSSGRLEVEAAVAKPVPPIAAGTLHGMRAKTAGTVVSTNLIRGTMLVQPGQTVEAGQGLIGTARTERNGALIFEPAAGTVRARIVWKGEFWEEMHTETPQLTGNKSAHYQLLFAGHSVSLSCPRTEKEPAVKVRHWQPELLGLPLPVFVEETTYYAQEPVSIQRTEKQALELGRLHSLQALYAAYPDAEILTRKESVSSSEGKLRYLVSYTIVADICE